MHLVALKDEIDTQPTQHIAAVEPYPLLATLRAETEDALTVAMGVFLYEKNHWPASIRVGFFAYWALGCPAVRRVDDDVYVPFEPVIGLENVELVP